MRRVSCGIRVPPQPLLVILLGLAVSAASARPPTEFPFDLRLVRRLSERQFHEYALEQVELLLQRYPDPTQRQQVLLEKARLVSRNQPLSACLDILAAIEARSPYYPEAQALAAELALRHGNRTAAAAAFTRYFETVRENENTNRRIPPAPIRERAEQYIGLLLEQGNTTEAAEIATHLAAGNADGSGRLVALWRAEITLAAAEANRAAGQELDEAELPDLRATLKQLQWQMDGIAAAAWVGTARTWILEERPEAAMTALETGQECIAAVHAALRRKRREYASPAPAALLHYGRALKVRAFAGFRNERMAAAKQDLLAAAKRFARILREYPQAAVRLRAYQEFEKCRNLLQREFDTRIALGGRAAQVRTELALESAENELRQGNFREALPALLRAVRADRRHPRFPARARELASCLVGLKRYLEAEAIAAHLATDWPDAEETAAVHFALAGSLTQHTGTDAARTTEAAVAVLTQFAARCPTQPAAAAAALAAADQVHQRAQALAAATTTGTAAVTQNEPLPAAAEEAYREAVRRYQWLLKRFPNAEETAAAGFRKAVCLRALGEARRAALAFLACCDRNPDTGHSRRQAKFHAADQWLQAGKPERAVEHLRELEQWLQNSGGADPRPDADAAQLMEQTAAYLAWACVAAAAQVESGDGNAGSGAADELDTGAAGTTPEREAAGDASSQAAGRTWKEEAAAQFLRCLQTYPKAEQAAAWMVKLGELYEDLGQTDEALSALETVLESGSAAAAKQALFRLGWTHCENGRSTAAATVFGQVLEHPDGMEDAHLEYIARNMLAAGEPGLARAASVALLARQNAGRDPAADPLHESALFHAGAACLATGDPGAAIRHLDTLLERYPNTGWHNPAKLRLGLAKRTTDPPDPEAAIQAFSAVLMNAQSPEDASEALCRIGETLAARGAADDVRRALARFRQVAMLADPAVPGNAAWIELALFNAAACYARMGEKTQCEELSRRYREQYPDGRYAREVADLAHAEPETGLRHTERGAGMETP